MLQTKQMIRSIRRIDDKKSDTNNNGMFLSFSLFEEKYTLNALRVLDSCFSFKKKALQ